ncbi:hypothetical protein AHAS_Ahas20G0220000 [Arachis hypogaea]
MITYHSSYTLNMTSDKRKGKATSKKRKRAPNSTFSPYVDYSKNPIDDEERANQSLPAQDPVKFPNIYCELRFPSYNKKNLNIEKNLVILSDLRQTIHNRIERMGLDFVDREHSWVNRSWVQEFYCNFFRHTLDSVLIRGIQVPITEQAIEDALTCRPKAGQWKLPRRLPGLWMRRTRHPRGCALPI